VAAQYGLVSGVNEADAAGGHIVNELDMGPGFRLSHKEGGVIGHPKLLDYDGRYVLFQAFLPVGKMRLG
jgi:hypothetical protein